MAETGTLLLPLDVRDRALARLERWTAESSSSGEPDGLERMSERLVTEAARLGLTARTTREPDEDGRELPVVEIRSPTLSERPLLLVGHFDTVLSAIAPRRDGDRLVATGAIDMKGGIVAFFGALELLLARRPDAVDQLDFRLLLAPDEEVGGAISRRLIERDGVGARALWVLEPGEPSPDAKPGGETLVAGRRGLFQWRLAARGRAAHSGLHFWQGRSALVAALEWAAAAAALSRPHDGPTVNVARFVGGDREFVDRLAESAGRLGSARELNVVPDRALVEGEARFLRAEEEHGLHQALLEAAERIGRQHGVDLDYRRFARIAPVDPRRTGRDWVERAVAAASAAGWRLDVEENRGGISFPNFLTEPGSIPVLDGLGPVGGGMHTREEYVEIPSLERRIALLADLLEADDAERRSAHRA
jgi:glutamate carboxypeptidase